MLTRDFRANRAAFPQAELDRYQGQWVAFNAEGNLVLAWGEDIGQVEAQLLAQGNSPNDVALERIPSPEDDSLLGGQEFQ
jgi:hypothetical protein